MDTVVNTPSDSGSLKYRLTDDVIACEGRELFRIEAIRDFDGVSAGDRGGFIQKDANLSHQGNCWVHNDAKVFDDASVGQDANVFGYARIFESARIADDAVVAGDAQVFGHARIIDRASVSEHARVYDSASIEDNARVTGWARVCGNATMEHRAKVCNHAVIEEDAFVCDDTTVRQNAIIGGDTRLHGCTKISGQADIRIGGAVTNSDVGGHTKMFGAAVAVGATLQDVTATVPVIVVTGLPYPVTISDSTVRIGCRQFDFDYWRRHGLDIMVMYVSPKQAKRMMKALKPLLKHQEKRVRKAAKSG